MFKLFFIDHTLATRCSAWEWECRSGQCIYDDYKCDGEYDCYDNSDESYANCRKSNVSQINLAFVSRF